MSTVNNENSDSSSKKKQRVIIIPGMGCTPLERCNWYRWLESELLKSDYAEPILREMPDPYECHEHIWLPFIRNDLKVDSDSIVIGHSSGAEAGMRLCEETKIKGLILVSACHTDLGSEAEAESGYYNREWQWEKIRQNTEWIVQYHSVNDTFISVEEGRFVAKYLKSQYIEDPDKGHFLMRKFTDLRDLIEFKCKGRIAYTAPDIKGKSQPNKSDETKQNQETNNNTKTTDKIQ